tara:strand:+ start:149 stop:5653 length:5505 start_codon:yes stop_codon:yes gene_type:complete
MNTSLDIQRAAAISAFEIFDTLPEAAFDTITRLASHACDVPVALITFMDADRQFYKSVYGASLDTAKLQDSLCYFTMQQDAGITIIENAAEDPRFKGNPFVASKNPVLFYAGVPIKTPENIAVGTLCLIDYKPNTLSDKQKDALSSLAVQVEQLLKLRKATIESERVKTGILQQSNRLNNILNAAQVGTWEWNVKTDAIEINDRYAEMLGYAKEELKPTTLQIWYKLIHPEDAGLSDELVKKCFDKEIEFYEMECRMNHKDGHTIWIQDRGKVVAWTQDGKPLMMMGTHIDITAKKNTELRLKNITDNIPGVVFRYMINNDGDDKLVQISKGAKEIWGFSPEEIANNNRLVWNNIHPEDIQSLITSIEEAYKNFSPWTHEWRYLHPDGETKWNKGSGNPIKIDDDTRVWDCFTLDITDKKKAEDELNHTVASLRERTKEINCLYEVTRLTQEKHGLHDFLKEVLQLVPQGFKYPESAKVAIRYGDVSFKSPGYRKSKHILEYHTTSVHKNQISLSVCYPASISKKDTTPFLNEETVLLKSLINSILLHINQFESGNEKDLILDSTVEGIYGIDITGKCSFINPSGAKMLGYSQEECLGKNLHELIHFQSEDGALIPEKECPIYKTMITKKISETDDDIFWRKDGSYFPVRYTSTPIIEDGKPTGAVVVFSDISEKKQKENLILYNEKRFKALVQEGSDLISILDSEGNYTYVSPTSRRVLGVAPESLLGKNINQFIHPDDWNEIKKNIALLGEQKQIITNPFRYKDGNNQWRWIETTATNLLDDPAIEGIVTNSRDVTERLLKEKELQISNERYQIVNKATNDAIYDWDVVNDLFYWGDGFERLFGYEYKDKKFQLQDWIDLTHPQDAKHHEKRWVEFFTGKNRDTWKNEFRFLKEDGSYAYVEENGIMIRDAKGKPIRMIGALRDKTTVKIAALKQQVEFEVAKCFQNRNNKLTDSLDEVLTYLVTFSGFDIAEIWLTSADNKSLNLFKVFDKSEISKTFYKASPEFSSLKKGEGLPGKVWQSNSIQHIDDINSEKKFHRHRAAKRAGLKSAVGIPLLHNQNPVGVLVFSSTLLIEEVQEEIKIFESLGQYLGAEIRRKQQEEEIQLFFDNAPEIMAVANAHGYFIKVNPAFCSILGYTKEELTSQPITHFIHPEDVNQTQTEYAENISGNRRASNFTNRYRTKDGNYRWISWNSSEVYGEENLVYAYGRDITELVELQRLVENAAKLAKVGSWELDLRDTAANNNMYWSTMTRQIMEVDPNYNPTHSAGLEFYPGEHKRSLSKAVQNLIKTGEPFDLELQLLTAKGNSKWVRCIGESERIDGTCIRVFGSYQDINQRKQAELKVKETLDERNNILESIADGFFAVDQDWHVTYWNHKAEELLMTRKEHILGKKLWDVFAAHVGLKSYKNYHMALRYQEVVHFEDYYPENNSWLEVSAYPSKSGLSVYFKNITERKQQEKTIRETHERFEKITEATNDAIWDYDVVNNHLFWGKGFENQFGYTLDEITPTLDFLVSRIHPDDQNRIGAKIGQYMGDGVSTNWFEEYHFKKADGTYALIIDRAIFIRDENGVVTRVIGAMTDISYRKEYEESLKKLNERLKRHSRELEISNEELEQFAYVTSHDLQEPLRMISSFLMLLEKKYGDKLDEKALEYIFYAIDGAKRMKKIILDLLEFSKVGRFDEEKTPVDINEIIKEYCILRKKTIREKKASLHYENLPKIEGYSVPLTQVFYNLLDNALKYSKEEEAPSIQIQAAEHANHWEFAITDNGIGMEEKYFNKIFIIFQRLHDKDTYEGTGMGLAIVKKIIETLEGKIWVTSQPGKGSTFFFTVPKTN